MRGALLLMSSLIAAGCGGDSDDSADGPSAAAPVIGRWRLAASPVPTPPVTEDLSNVEFFDDGTITDLSSGDDGVYDVSGGQLATTIMRPSGARVHTSQFERVDQHMLRVALRRDAAGDGWAGTWRGEERNENPQGTVVTQWMLVLTSDGGAQVTETVGGVPRQTGGIWQLETTGGWDWVVIESVDGDRGWATVGGHTLGRVGLEIY